MTWDVSTAKYRVWHTGLVTIAVHFILSKEKSVTFFSMWIFQSSPSTSCINYQFPQLKVIKSNSHLTECKLTERV